MNREDLLTAYRRMLLIRSAQIPVPAALAQRSIQVVFGEEPAALGTLRAASDSWRLTARCAEMKS